MLLLMGLLSFVVVSKLTGIGKTVEGLLLVTFIGLSATILTTPLYAGTWVSRSILPVHAFFLALLERV